MEIHKKFHAILCRTLTNLSRCFHITVSAAVTISKTSGLAGIAYWLNHHYEIAPEDAITKHDAITVHLKEWVDKQYEDGRQTVITTREMEAAVHAYVAEHETKGIS